MGRQDAIREALDLIFRGIAKLRQAFPEKAFTIDGRLVGDIGEVIAELEYDLVLYKVQTSTHDGETPDGRKVQIKATFKDHLTITAVPEFYLGLSLSQGGGHEEVYNGPGSILKQEFQHRSGIGEKQLSLPIRRLRQLSATVPEAQRIKRRAL
jgi:hypothetical protein